MGNFYTNITILGDRAGEALGVMRELGREAYVANLTNACVVYDRECDEQRTDVLSALADELAVSLEAISFAVLNHDDDILWFQLFDRTELVAEYSNRGGPGLNVRAMCRALGRPHAVLRVWWLTHRPFLFQIWRHAHLARCLGLPEASVGFGFDYVHRGELPDDLDEDRLVHVRRGG